MFEEDDTLPRLLKAQASAHRLLDGAETMQDAVAACLRVQRAVNLANMAFQDYREIEMLERGELQGALELAKKQLAKALGESPSADERGQVPVNILQRVRLALAIADQATRRLKVANARRSAGSRPGPEGSAETGTQP